jgi:glycosyltransferase 2 family protein
LLSRSTVLRALLGAAVSLVALWLVLRAVDLGRTLEIVRSAAPGWILAVAGFLVLDVMLRALRWQRLIAPLGHVRYRSMLGYLLIGYLANNLLPARLGELVRSHYLGDREGISRTTTLGTVVVERVVDLGVVVAIAAASILVLSVRGIVANAVLLGVAIATLLAVVLVIGVAAHRLPGAGRFAALAGRWPKVRDVVANLRGGLAVAGRPRTLLETVGLSCLAWAATILAFAAAGQAVGVELTMGQAALLGSGVALASAIPAGPASLGTFEFAAVQIATSIGVPDTVAFAMALIAHAASLLITVPAGGVVLARIGWRRDEPASAVGA